MALTTISEIFKNPKINSIIKVSGWVRTRRGSKSVSFIALNDGSTIKNKASPENETKSSKTIRLQTTESRGETNTKAVTL